MLLAEAEGDDDDDDVVEEEAEQETPAKKPKKVFMPPPVSRCRFVGALVLSVFLDLQSGS